MFDLRGKIALITGASSGIGEGCARSMAQAGADLILAARRRDRVATLSDELIQQHGIQCHYGLLDVRRQPEVESFVRSLPVGFADIDILVNNAGLARGMNLIHEGVPKDWDEMIDTNIKGLLYVTRAVVPGMVERGRGHVVNIGSIAGRLVYPMGVVYCGTKFAERAITQGTMIDLVDTPVRVTTVDPGLVETEFSLVRFRGDDDKAAGVYKGLTALSASDVADAVLYCVTRPQHVNVSEMVVLPTDQASPYHIRREE